MSLPITPIIDLLNSLLCGVCGIILYRSYQRDQKSVVLLYFAYGYFSLIVAYLFFSIPRIAVPEKSFVLGIAFIIAQSFLYLAIAHFSKVTTFFINVQLVRRVFWFVIVAAIIATALNIVYFGYPEHDVATGVTNWDIHPIVGIASTVVLGSVLLTSSIYFLWQGFRSRNKIVKRRSITIAIGLILLTITAYTYYSATTQITALLSDMLSLISFLIIFFGVIYKRGSAPIPHPKY